MRGHQERLQEFQKILTSQLELIRGDPDNVIQIIWRRLNRSARCPRRRFELHARLSAQTAVNWLERKPARGAIA
jgi:hypothetical protein